MSLDSDRPAEASPPPGDAVTPVAPGQSAGNRYLRALGSGRGAFGVGLVLAVVLVSLIGPLFIPYGPNEQGPDGLLPPLSPGHPLGTDEIGRDLLARVLAGTRVDLLMTLIAVPVAAVAGTLLGLVGVLSAGAGAVVQRIFDVFLGVPGVILGIGITIALAPGMVSVVVAIVLVTMPLFGRQARSSLLGQLPLDYVAAAQVLDYPKRRIMLRHILPNIVDVLFVRFAIEMAHAISLEGSLSVVGLGIQPPQASLGAMIKSGSGFLLTLPAYALAPVLVVVLLVMGYTLMASAMNRTVLRS